MSSSSSTAGGRQTTDELEGRMELGIELGEEMEEEEAHLYPAYRSMYGKLNNSTQLDNFLYLCNNGKVLG